MIAYGENIQVFCGNSNPQFAQTILQRSFVKFYYIR